MSALPHILQAIGVEAAAKAGSMWLCLIRVLAVPETPPSTHPTSTLVCATPDTVPVSLPPFSGWATRPLTVKPCR